MKKVLQNHKVKAIWQVIKPWLLTIFILIILRYTGALAGLSAVTNNALLETSVMDATPGEDEGIDDKLNFNFSVTSLNGESIDFNSFKGKTLFINLWATWCGPCRAEMPGIQHLYSDYSTNDSIAFVMLSLDRINQLKKVQSYVTTQKYSFPVYVASELPQELQVNSIPTTLVIAPDGTIAYKNVGMANYDTKKFRNYLQRIMQKKQAP